MKGGENMMDNIAFQLPASQAGKPVSPAVRKPGSASEQAVSPFNRLLDRTMSSQQGANLSDPEQTGANPPDDQDSLLSQGITNNLLLALAAPPTVMPVNEQPVLNPDAPTAKLQFAGALQNTANHAGMLLSGELQQQNSSNPEAASLTNESMETVAESTLNPAAGKLAPAADGQVTLVDKTVANVQQQPETTSAASAQTELQSKLDAVISTVTPFSFAAPAEPDPSSPVATPQLAAQQTELTAPLPVKAADTAPPASTQVQSQSPVLESNELLAADQSVVTPLDKREQVAAKQSGETESASAAPVQAQSVLNQLSQDGKHFQSQDDSLPANHGLTGLRANKPDELVFAATQQIAAPNQQDIISQIVDRARLYLRPANQSEMVLQLRPEHLGELTLKVSVEAGVVSAAFHSDNPEVRQVIEASLPQLKQDLSQQGIKLDNVSVFSGSEQFFDNGQRFTQQQQTIPLRKNRQELLQAVESAETAAVSITDGVDYRI
jgi:flagellar hook-length control protein FliK